jgi:hypothetical protein
MKVLVAPERGAVSPPAVFLAGSIEQGLAVDWQARVISELADLDCTVLNPRRPVWNASWVQDITNKEFETQVRWELDYIRTSTAVLMYLQPGTQSPISLLELGLLAGVGVRTVVVCPPGFWRRGNVQVLCSMFQHLELFDDLDLGIERIKAIMLHPRGIR